MSAILCRWTRTLMDRRPSLEPADALHAIADFLSEEGCSDAAVGAVRSAAAAARTHDAEPEPEPELDMDELDAASECGSTVWDDLPVPIDLESDDDGAWRADCEEFTSSCP